jgi:hypothetical protein
MPFLEKAFFQYHNTLSNSDSDSDSENNKQKSRFG